MKTLYEKSININYLKMYRFDRKLAMPITKKQYRFYHNYIPRFVKSISSENGVTSNCRDQINSLLCNLNKIISDKSIEIVKFNNKKTITVRDVCCSISLVFNRSICSDIMRMYDTNILNYKSSENILKGSSKHAKAGMIFPPSISDKFLRDFGFSKIMVTNESPILLSTAIEYFMNKFISYSLEHIPSNKKRITIREFEMVREKNMSCIFNKNNLYFQGGGIIPYIHPSLEVNIRKSKKKRKNPGMLAIKNIRRYQKVTNCLMLSKSPFEKLIRNIFTKKGYDNIKISKQVFLIFQYFIEFRLIDIISKSNLISIHSKRVKLLGEDLKFYVDLIKLSYIEKFKDIYNKITKSSIITIDNLNELLNTPEELEDNLQINKVFF